MSARSLVLATAAASALACGSDQAASDAGRETPAARQESGAAPDPTTVAAGAPAACDLIPTAEIERLAGPLDGDPVREGDGCWYYVTVDTTTAEWTRLRAGADRARAAGMDDRAIALYHPTRAGLYVEADLRGNGGTREPESAAAPGGAGVGTAPRPEAGWDEVSASPSGAVFTGRAGYVRVSVRLQQLRLPRDTVAAVAARVRERIPEGPIPHPAADRTREPPPGPDPCSVLTREEAEAELGRLVAAPFRTKERSPLADPSGVSCAYLTAGHRVLVLTPEWEYGAMTLGATRMVGGIVRQVAELPGIEGDTLEGPWDDAVVDLTGELLLLKGGRALGIRYLMSSADAAGAIRLAGPALRRLSDSSRTGP